MFSWPCPDFVVDQDLHMTPDMHVLVGVQGEDCELQQVPWFALLQAVESIMECYSLAAASLLPCWCKWSRKIAPREMSCYLFSLRAGEFSDCTEPVLSRLVPDGSIGSVLGMYVF